MRIFTSLRLTIAVLLLSLPVRAATPATRPAAPIITLRGDASALGEAHAKALGDAIATLSSKFFDKALDPASRQMMSRGAMRFETTLRPEHLAEIRALAAPDDEHFVRRRVGDQGRVDQHLVVHELVPLRSLQGVVQDEAAAEDLAVNDF